MFEKLEGQFPEWEEHLGNTRIADLPRIFEAAGIPAEMLQPNDVPETVELFAESLGAIVSREKWWKDESKCELIDNWHAMRLIEIRDTELVVMNPGYAPRQSRLESLPIRDLKAIGSRIFVFRRREENA
ncbi:hypothetical protein HZ994_14055 [Akkermansiaceae bacterium]|nr:hypothetical protein HZ994_14055 [Akkermansiaceae bacterium]